MSTWYDWFWGSSSVPLFDREANTTVVGDQPREGACGTFIDEEAKTTLVETLTSLGPILEAENRPETAAHIRDVQDIVQIEKGRELLTHGRIRRRVCPDM